MIDDRALETARLEERRAIVRWILARAEEYSPLVRATIVRFVRRIEEGEHWWKR